MLVGKMGGVGGENLLHNVVLKAQFKFKIEYVRHSGMCSVT